MAISFAWYQFMLTVSTVQNYTYNKASFLNVVRGEIGRKTKLSTCISKNEMGFKTTTRFFPASEFNVSSRLWPHTDITFSHSPSRNYECSNIHLISPRGNPEILPCKRNPLTGANICVLPSCSGLGGEWKSGAMLPTLSQTRHCPVKRRVREHCTVCSRPPTWAGPGRGWSNREKPPYLPQAADPCFPNLGPWSEEWTRGLLCCSFILAPGH